MHQFVYVDLSAKVEHWNTDTAIAVADGFRASYIVPAKVKQACAGDSIEGAITSILMHMLRKDMSDATAGMIGFANVKGSRADLLARRVFERKVPPLRVFILEEMEAVLNRK